MPFGPVASYTLGDGQAVTLTYDANGAWTDVASTAFSLHVKRDVAGNIVAVGDAAGVPTPTEIYSYDALYRLTGVNAADGTAIEAYTYNKTGDRLSKVGPGLLTGAYSYAAGTHHLIGVGTTTRVVDARGNTTADVLASGAYGYGYNGRNRLTVVQNGGVTVGSYVLDALGQRVQKTAAGVTTLFDYDEESRLVSESVGNSFRDYIWMDGMPVGIVERSASGTVVNFVHADGLGSPRAVTNSLGTVFWQWPYVGNPFGEKTPVSSGGYTLNLRFAGQYFDTESTLNYNLHRDFEPAAGRYLQSDPVGLDGGVNTFAYSRSSPANRIDPNGQLDGSGPLAKALQRAGAVDAAGGGPEDPVGDVLALGVLGYTLADELARGANQEEVHRVCDEPPPPNLTDCERAKWKLTKALRCKLVRQRMADKWFGGTFDDGHAQRMSELENEIAALRRSVDRWCKPCP
jgi:RHS repeat-associated protein